MSSSVSFSLDKQMTDELTFEQLQLITPNIDEVLKKYLFRGWFVTHVLETQDNLYRCPCCHTEFKNETNS